MPECNKDCLNHECIRHDESFDMNCSGWNCPGLNPCFCKNKITRKKLTDREKDFALHGMEVGKTVKICGIEFEIKKKENKQIILEPIETPWYFMEIDSKTNKLYQLTIDNFDKKRANDIGGTG